MCVARFLFGHEIRQPLSSTRQMRAIACNLSLTLPIPRGDIGVKRLFGLHTQFQNVAAPHRALAETRLLTYS